jgi:hypothetical protein
MRRSVKAAAAAALVALTAGGCGGGTGTAHRAGPAEAEVSRCPPTRGAAFAGREALAIAGAAGLSYCRGGPRDPGQVIAVSPVEPTQQATRILR